MRIVLQRCVASFLFLATSFALAGDLGPAIDDSALKIYVPLQNPGWELSATGFFLQPQADNLGWSAITTVLPIPTPQWHVVSFNPDFQAGFNIGARYIFSNSGSDAQLNWSHLRSTDKDFVAVHPVKQWISPFSQTGTLPTMGAITGVANLKSALAVLRFNFDGINLDAGKYVNIGTKLQSRFFTGLTAISLQEKLISTFYGVPDPKFSINNTSTFNGAGLRIGLSNAYDAYRGVHLVGQMATGILLGRMQPAQYEFAARSAALSAIGIALNQEAVTSSSVSQLVPELDGKLALNYVFEMEHARSFTIELGYMGAIYFNPLSAYETSTNVIALDTGSLSTASVKYVSSNFSYNGPYMTFSMKI